MIYIKICLLVIFYIYCYMWCVIGPAADAVVHWYVYDADLHDYLLILKITCRLKLNTELNT